MVRLRPRARARFAVLRASSECSISGDMLLPRISTNVAVRPIDPRSNPLRLFLESIRRYRDLPEDVLVLPSHGLPFRGAHARVAQLEAHHAERLEELRSGLRAVAARGSRRARGPVQAQARHQPDLLRAGRGDRASASTCTTTAQLARAGSAPTASRVLRPPRPEQPWTTKPTPTCRTETARVLQEVRRALGAAYLPSYATQGPRRRRVSAASDELGIAKAYMDLYATHALRIPRALAALSTNLMVDYMQLWQSSWMKHDGRARRRRSPSRPRATTASRTTDWSSNFLFDYIKQSYLIAARHIQHAVANVEGLSPESEKKVAFFTRQYVDALAPSNFALTNPQVLRETLASGGQNLLQRPEQPARRHREGRASA